MTLDFVAGLTAAVQRTAFREPLRRDARTIDVWNQRHKRVDRLCQAYGETAPCRLHQPSVFMTDEAA